MSLSDQALVRPGAGEGATRRRGCLRPVRLRLERWFPSLARFLRWWLAELAGLVPRRLKRALLAARPLLLLAIGEEDLIVSRFDGRGPETIGRLELRGTTPGQQCRELARLLGDRAPGGHEVVLRLPRSQSLSWRIELPGTAESDLADALALQILRRTPFQSGETCSDYRIVERSADGARMVVEVAVAPRRCVEEALARASAWNMTPERIDVAAEDDHPEPRFDLLRRGPGHGADGRLMMHLNALLAAVVIALLLATVALPLERRNAWLEALDLRLAEARAGAEATLALQAEVERLTGESRFLTAAKRRYPARVEVIEELSAVLPDHTSLSELRINGAEVQIVGSSAAASTLLALVDASPLFRRPRFRSPVTQDPRDGLERFNLSLELEEHDVAGDDL